MSELSISISKDRLRHYETVFNILNFSLNDIVARGQFFGVLTV